MRIHKHYSLTALVLLSLFFNATLAGGPAIGADAIEQASARLAGSILVNGHSMHYLRELTDRFGGRLTGSTAYKRSAEWAAEQFRAAGIKNVKLEPWSMINVWDRGWARGRITSPLDRPIHIESLGWAPSTPPGGVKAEVIEFGDLDPKKIKAQNDKLKGRAVMLDLASVFADGFSGFAKLITALPLFKDAGTAALIVSDSERNNVLNAFGFTWGGQTSPLPLAQVGMEDGQLIERLMAKGPVTIEFAYENRTGGPAQVNNVIAEIPGRERPDEWIIIGAHLDSWDYGTGAQDNGSGSAQVLDAARAIAAMPAPRRSIRFALWGGEEEGLLGSAAYVKAHKAELGKCVAALNTDNGAGHPKGWKVEGRKDLGDAMMSISNSLLEGLGGGGGRSQQVTFDTDHAHFMLEGIPSLDLWVDYDALWRGSSQVERYDRQGGCSRSGRRRGGGSCHRLRDRGKDRADRASHRSQSGW